MKIAELRLEKSWTQEELAEACRLNVRTIQRAESGQSISGKSLSKITKALNTNTSELDIRHASLDISLIDRKLATQFKNVKFFQNEAITNIEIYPDGVISKLKLIQIAIYAVILGCGYWTMRSLSAPSDALFWATFLMAAYAAYSALKNLFGKIIIDISPESLRQQLYIGAIKIVDKNFDADLVSDFEVCRHNYPFHTMCYLQFQYGFKNTKLDMGYLEAEARFVMIKIEEALESN